MKFPETATNGPVTELLDPRAEVVPFAGREDELGRLLAWCTDPLAGPIRLVSGGAGTGKTRLALRLAQLLSDSGWWCEWIGTGAEAVAASAVRDGSARHGLLIGDQAETRTELEELLHAAAVGGGTVRVLLLARHAGYWWQRLGVADMAARPVFADANRFRIDLHERLAPHAADIDVIQNAVPYFAARMGLPALDPGLLQLSSEPPVSRALDLHAIALVAAISASRAPRGATVPIDPRTALNELLAAEMNYWLGQAAHQGLLGTPGGMTDQQVRQAVAAVSVLGAPTLRDAIEVLSRVPRLHPTPALTEWLAGLYPAGPGEGFTGSLRPDRLAELHATNELASSPELAGDCLTGLNPRQAGRALILLAQASHELEPAWELLESALIGDAAPLPWTSVPRSAMIAIANSMPSSSVPLAPALEAIVHRIADTFGPGEPARATWLNERARLLSLLGRQREALAVADEALAIRRKLAAGNRAGYLATLAGSLNNRSTFLLHLGRRDEALAASSEAVASYRELCAWDHETFAPDLAMSLTSYSSCLSRVGRWTEALAASEEAVSLRRELAAVGPDAFRFDLATSLTLNAARLSSLGRRDEALAVGDEALAIWRELAAARPDQTLPALAALLHNQSTMLSDLGRGEEALASIEVALTIWRGLAADHPNAILLGLAESLNSYSLRLADLGLHEAALAAIDEALGLLSELASERPDAILPDLAASLHNRSLRLAELDRPAEALAAICEALTIRRQLAASYPDAYLPGLAASLGSQSGRLSALGRRDEAAAAADESVSIYRMLAESRPEVFLRHLARALNDLSDRLSALGRREHALAAVRESVAIYRRLTAERPKEFASLLARSLDSESRRLSELGRRADARAASAAAAEIRWNLVADKVDADHMTRGGRRPRRA